MDIVHFRHSEEFAEVASKLFEEQKSLLQKEFPYADIQHIGGTAVPGLLTKGDLDINVRVSLDQFGEVIKVLKKLYEINQPENWSSVYASFKDDSKDLGVQVTVKGSEKDFFVLHRDSLQRRPELVLKLNEIKRAYEGKDMSDYRAAKGAFLEEHIAYQYE